MDISFYQIICNTVEKSVHGLINVKIKEVNKNEKNLVGDNHSMQPAVQALLSA